MKPETAEAVMHALGARMYHHGFCIDHPLSAAIPVDCPYCADRQAYIRYNEFIHRAE